MLAKMVSSQKNFFDLYILDVGIVKDCLDNHINFVEVGVVQGVDE